MGASILALIVGFAPTSVKAQVLGELLFAQTVATASTTYISNNNSGPYDNISIGTGVSGVLEDVYLRLQFDSLTSVEWKISVWECTQASVDNNSELGTYCDNIASSVGVVPDVLTESNFRFTFTNGVTLYSDKYYQFRLVKQWADSQKVSIFGGSSDVISNEDSWSYNSGVSASLANITDGYIQMYGVDLETDFSWVGDLQPYTGSTTVSTVVTLSSQYNNIAADSFTRYVFDLNDISAGIEHAAITGDITVGTGSFSKSISLTSGHLYSIKSYICNSSYYNCSSSAGPNTFWVVSTTTVPVYPQNNTDVLLPFSTSTTFRQGGLTASTSIGTTFSTSTNDTILSKLTGILPQKLVYMLQTKFPFSYVFDGIILFDEIGGASASTTIVSFQLPQGNGTATTVPIINTSSLEGDDLVTGIRELIGNGMYLIVGIYLIGSIMSAF